MQLKEEIAEFWECGSLIYSVGWLAGFGVIKGLVKDYDHIVIDEFADNSFFEGSRAATRNVHKFRHLDEGHMTEIVKAIRAKDTDNSILVVTEGIFPMDSSSPNLVSYQKTTADNKAYLLVGCGHDLGVIG
jgi:glycine C-acetyltransferase